MPGYLVQHVIEKWQTSLHLKLAAAIKIHGNGYLSFLGITLYTGLSR